MNDEAAYRCTIKVVSALIVAGVAVVGYGAWDANSRRLNDAAASFLDGEYNTLDTFSWKR